MKLTIPKQHRDGIARIQDLDAPTVERLHAAISGSVASLGPTQMSATLLPPISVAGIENAKQLADTISALYRVKSANDVTIEEFADSVCDAVGLSGSERDRLRTNLLALLSIEKLSLNAKAVDLQTEDERTFCDARILTDLRPVFGPHVSEGPKAMVIVHLLKLGYHQASADRHQDFYVSLDADDLKTLRKIIDRAEEKAKILKATVINFDYLARS